MKKFSGIVFAAGFAALSGAAQTTGAAPAAAISDGKTINACAILSADEVAKVIGMPVQKGEPHDDGATTDGTFSSTCLWRVPRPAGAEDDPTLSLGGASYAILNAQLWPAGSGGAKKFLESFYQAAKDNTIDQEPVPVKAGEDALWWGDGVALRKGDISVGISIHLVGGRPKERGMEEALAGIIAGRL